MELKLNKGIKNIIKVNSINKEEGIYIDIEVNIGCIEEICKEIEQTKNKEVKKHLMRVTEGVHRYLICWNEEKDN